MAEDREREREAMEWAENLGGETFEARGSLVGFIRRSPRKRDQKSPSRGNTEQQHGQRGLGSRGGGTHNQQSG